MTLSTFKYFKIAYGQKDRETFSLLVKNDNRPRNKFDLILCIYVNNKMYSKRIKSKNQDKNIPLLDAI